MATQNPLYPPGQWVQFNMGTDKKHRPLPSIAEQTIGQVRQAFTGMNGPYYMVVWNPGSKRPRVGMYQGGQLCAITQQQQQQIANQMQQGQYTVQTGSPNNPKGVSV